MGDQHAFFVKVLEAKGLKLSKHILTSPQAYINVRLVKKTAHTDQRGRRGSHMLNAEDVIKPSKLDSSPYVKVSSGAASFGGHVFSWPYDVVTAGRGCLLVLKLKEKTLLADEEFARLVVDVDLLLAAGPRSAWYPLEPKLGGEAADNGELLLESGVAHPPTTAT
eukprot:tig00001415_g8684.t1